MALAEGWARWSSEVPSNPSKSVILWWTNTNQHLQPTLLFSARPKPLSALHVPSCLSPHLPPSLPAQPERERCALCHCWSKLPAPVCYFFTLPPMPTYPLRYPVASPAAKHLLLGENLLLGNRFLKQQLWLCHSLNFTLPAWNNEPTSLLEHLCIYNPLKLTDPLEQGCACLLVCYCSQLIMQKGSKQKFCFFF